MAKAANRSTLSPNLFSLGQGVVIEDIQEVVEQLHYSMAYTPHVLWQTQCEPAGWGSAGTELETADVRISSGTYVTLFRGHVWIDPDAQSLTVYLEGHAETSNTIEIQATVGSDFDSTTWTAETSEKSLSLQTSNTGTGWQAFSIEGRRTAGSSDLNRLRSARIVVDEWSSLPDVPGQITVTAPSGFSNASSLDYDGTNDFVEAADHADLDLTSAMTFSAWCLLDTAAANKTIATKWAYQTQGGWALQTSHSAGTPRRLTLFLATSLTDNGTGCRIVTDADAYTAGSWFHVAWTFNAGTVVIYIDGTAVAHTVDSGSIPASLQSNSAALRVGAWSGSLTRYWGPGNLDEVSLFDVALDASEISELYNSGAPADVSAHSRWADCVLWWRMGDGDTYPTITDQRAGGGAATTSHDGTMTNMTSGDIAAEVP